MLKRLGFVLLAAFAACFPLGAGAALGMQAPAWYLAAFAVVSTVGFGVLPAAFGLVVLLASRGREGGGLRPAIVTTITLSLLVTLVVMRAGG